MELLSSIFFAVNGVESEFLGLDIMTTDIC